MTNVCDFGATGDGKTDDTAAIQHAIDEGIGLVTFPRGVYRITKSLIVDLQNNGWTSFDGQGATAQILMAGAGPALIIKGSHGGTADPQSYRSETWKHERMPLVRDIEIVGQHPSADGIRMDGVTQPSLFGVLLRALRHGIHITGRSRNVLIEHCHIYFNKGIGIFLDQVNLHQTIISGSHISYCRLGGIRVEQSEIRNLQITGNDIEYNNNRSHRVEDGDAEATAEIYLDARRGSIREGTICSNTIQSTYSPNGANIRMIGQGAENNPKVGMWTISGNLIGSQWNNIHLSGAQGVSITGNYIYSGHNRNVLIEDSHQIILGNNCFGHNADYGEKRELCTGLTLRSSHDCIVNSNLLQDCQSGQNTFPNTPELQREALLECYDCRNITISNTQILDSSPYGIRLHETRDVTLSAVTVTDRRNPCLQESSIWWTGDAGQSIITGCRLGPSRSKTIQADSDITLYGCSIENH